MADIKCPKCKATVPKTPICPECGFDIKSYYVSRKKVAQQKIKCPKCSKAVPKKPICAECGFDIKAYYMEKRAEKAAAGQAPARTTKPRSGRKKTVALAAGGIVVLALIAAAAYFVFGGEKAISREEAYLGCFTDQGNPRGLDGRDMSGAWIEKGDLTVEQCVSFCDSKDFGFAGVQYSSHCFCDNDYGASGASENCNMPCSGDSSETCGGPWANSVYKVAPLLTASSKGSAGSESSGGRSEKPGTTKAEKSLSWDDPKGDTYSLDKMNKPFIDIVGAEASSKDGYLVLEFIADKDIDDYLSITDKDGYRFGYKPVSVFIDTDNNPDSGSAPSWAGSDPGDIRGYSHEVDVLMGFLFRQEGTDVPGSELGDIKIAPERHRDIIGGTAHYWVDEAAYPEGWSRMRKQADEYGAGFDELASLKGNRIMIKVPYELLGVQRGQAIRLCFKEDGQDGREIEKFSENKVLILR